MQDQGFGCTITWHEVFTLEGGIRTGSFIKKVVLLGEKDWK
jgi:hypothetical protein